MLASVLTVPAFFKPNIIFGQVWIPATSIWDITNRFNLDSKIRIIFGMILFTFPPTQPASLAIEKPSHLWMTNIPVAGRQHLGVKDNNSSALISLLICRNWKGTLMFIFWYNPNWFLTKQRHRETLNTMVRFPKNTSIKYNRATCWKKCDSTEERPTFNIFILSQGNDHWWKVQIVNEIPYIRRFFFLRRTSDFWECIC